MRITVFRKRGIELNLKFHLDIKKKNEKQKSLLTIQFYKDYFISFYSHWLIVHPERTSEWETGWDTLCLGKQVPYVIRCISQEECYWTQILASSPAKKMTKIINLRYLFFVNSSNLFTKNVCLTAYIH